MTYKQFTRILEVLLRFRFTNYFDCIRTWIFFNPENLNLENQLKESYGLVDFLISRAKKGEVSCQIHLDIPLILAVKGFVGKDTEKAIGWLDTTVQNGCFNPLVLQKLGQLLDLTGEPHNQRKVYDLYHKAARLGSTSAQLNLADIDMESGSGRRRYQRIV